MRPFAVTLGVLACAVALAAVPAVAFTTAPPPGATAQCRDGTYSYSQHHAGTCSYHGGVAVWLDGSSSSSAAASIGPSSRSCGVERWTVKTLQDRPPLLPEQPTTLNYLITRPAPASIGARRLPFERHVFRVTAAVVLVRAEADGDLHLLLSTGGRQMIAESPSPSCDAGASPSYRREMTTARTAVRVCGRARIAGVAFFDFDHGQTGVAPNAIELHPILGFACLAG
jgi:hypothetical protein